VAGACLNERILALLRNGSGQYLSREELARRLDASIAAVSDEVRRLQTHGYEIETHPQLGYRLISVPDLLLPQEIRHGLQTRLMGQRIYYYQRIESTNRTALELAQDDAAEGTLVLAEEQLAGRGRQGRVWHSAPRRGLWFSLVLHPDIPSQRAFQLTICGALAMAETVYSRTHLDVRVKWPNDVLINGRKIAGVLTEAQLDGNTRPLVILGMGMNVNHLADDFPTRLRRRATSLRIELGRSISRVGLLRDLLSSFEAIYGQYLSHGLEPFLDRWRQLSCVIGQPVTVQVGGQVYAGTAVAVDATGALVLETGSGKRQHLLAGDIQLTRAASPDGIAQDRDLAEEGSCGS
jgi:BirA family biotin operon repressor/biotin-[acetyl-CoA-carboxylase] ligase